MKRKSEVKEILSARIDALAMVWRNFYAKGILLGKSLEVSLDIIFHYPPELLNLLVDAIPLLCRSKKDVLIFFKGAGVPGKMTADFWQKVASDPSNVNKYEIVREVLVRLNNDGEKALRERREVLKRVVEFEDFSTCWPTDQLKAKGLVAEIRRVVEVKDSFGKMRQEREAELRSDLTMRKRKLPLRMNGRQNSGR